MIALSSRYATAAALLLVAAGVLNLMISRNLSARETCANPNALPQITRQADFEPRGRMSGKITESLIEWAEGRVPARSGSPAKDVWLIRSIRPAEIYERPVRFLEQKVSPEIHDLVEVETASGTIPVHFLGDYTTQPGTVVGYVLVYGNDPTEDAFRTHVGHLFTSITQGATPLTLIMVSHQASRRGSEISRGEVSDVLAGAFENFDAACRP